MKPKEEVIKIEECKKHKFTEWKVQEPIVVPNQPVLSWKERHCVICGYTEGVKNI